MTADHLNNIEQFDADLWKMADSLRANSGVRELATIAACHLCSRHIAGIVGVILVCENDASDTDCRIFLLNSFSFSICGATNDEHRQARER
jgi:hypothetical protein